MSFFDDALQSETLAAVKARIAGYAASTELVITSWASGDVGEQVFQVVGLVSFLYTGVVARVVRGYASLDTSTDPGDVDAYDSANVDLEPAAGMLSNLGRNVHSTTRGEETPATGFFTFINAGPGARSFLPGALVFTWTAVSPPSPAPTYRNVADTSIYTNPDGTVTVAAGASLVIPIEAEEVGTGSNAPPSAITLTTTLTGVSGTNAAAVLGTDREDADVYRARCRQASARLSFDGPADAYRYFAAKDIDGDSLVNANGDTVNITKVYVSEDSDEAEVDIYFASPSGPAIADDVDAANDNILTHAFIVPDAITIGPGVPGGVAATATAITVAGTVKVKQQTGGLTGTALQTAVKAAIVAALTDAFESDSFNPIGGVDRVAGAGVIYTSDLHGVVRDAYTGLYSVAITTPAGSSTAILLGHIATLTTAAGSWSVTVVP